LLIGTTQGHPARILRPASDRVHSPVARNAFAGGDKER
jgi:hypothetical protein